MRNLVKHIVVMALVLTALPALAFTDTQPDGESLSATALPANPREVMCVPSCLRRSYSARCLQPGPAYCAPGPGVACIPYCITRMANGSCINYSADFCGINPVCVPYCAEVSFTGQCKQYDIDQCTST